MKDPAVLFYFQDFLVGTEFMTDDEIGKYIRILCHQADKGALSECQLKRICRSEIPEAIKKKLLIDGNGNFYQNRMKIEKERREKFSLKQRERINKRWSKKELENDTVVLPNIGNTFLENENENENENINEDKNRINVQFENFRKSYPGTKRGYKIEFENLKAKHKDWKEIILTLNEKLQYQINAREVRKKAGGFVPEWKNLKTWLNQRCWEEEINIVVDSKIPSILTYEEILNKSKDDPEIWKRYKSVKKEGERKAIFVPIESLKIS